MNYTTMEERVGDIVDEPGTKPAGDWMRYSQALRRQAIAWAELEAAKYLPIDETPKLKASVTSLSDIVEGLISNASLPPDLMEVLELYDEKYAAYLINFIYWDDQRTLLRKNLNATGEHAWFWKADDIQLIFPSAYNPSDEQIDLHYKKFPPSYDLSKYDKETHWQLLMHGNVTGGGDNAFLAGEQLEGGTSGALGTITYVGDGYVWYTVDADQLLAGETVTSDAADGNNATATFVSNEFLTVETPFEGYEEDIITGAAGKLLHDDGDPRGAVYIQQFNTAIGKARINEPKTSIETEEEEKRIEE